MNPRRLAELEEERRFLLASIRDIERERAAGDVDATDFEALRDGYVARAAAVLREIDDGRSSLLPRPVRPWWRRVLVVAVTLSVAVALGVFVAQSAGQRLPGQSLTGGLPDDEVALQLAEGRRLLGTDSAGARAAYERVVKLEPLHPEAATYLAYLNVLDGRSAGDQALVQQGIDDLRAAATLDPAYGDPHCLLAVSAGTFLDPPDAALVRAEGAVCLALDPPRERLSEIESLIARFTDGATTTVVTADVDTLLAQADASQTAGDYAAALGLYQRVLELDPGNLVARSFSGYLVALNGNGTANKEQVAQGIELLQAVIDSDPDFANAHCLLALASHYFVKERDDALTKREGERCLALDAPVDVVPYVQDVLDALAAGG